MDTALIEVASNDVKSISEYFDDALKTFEGISNCDLATNSCEVQAS